MPMSLLFVHSPLVGPSTFRRMRDAALEAGHDAALPDLTVAATSAHPHDAYVDVAVQAAASLPGPVHVVGHSGAGAFLPLIGAGLTDLGGLTFVDAVVPPVRGHHRTTVGLHSMLDDHTVGERLEPWLDWWSDAVVKSLLPDPSDRAVLKADMPQLSRSFYDVDVAVPDRWADWPCSFLQLSAAYEEEASESLARGWPTTKIESTHLGIHTEPQSVLDAVVQLVAGAN